MDGAWDDTTHTGNEACVIAHGNDTRGGADHIDYIAGTRARTDGVPVGIEGANWNGNTAAKAEMFGVLRLKMAGDGRLKAASPYWRITRSALRSASMSITCRS